MPEHDLRALSAAFLLETVRLAHHARDTMPWGRAIPQRIFLEYVLPYAQANELRESWRPLLLDKFGPQVQGLNAGGAGTAGAGESVEAAVALLNGAVFAQLNVSYHATARPKPDMAPSESIACSHASCTGLSILLADTLRAVGIPARLASIPLWADHSGNHTWVEVWVPSDTGACGGDAGGGGENISGDNISGSGRSGRWRHIGASEQGPLDETWFTAKAALADDGHPYTSIYGLSFRPTGTLFPCVWLPHHDVRWLLVHAAYTQTCTDAHALIIHSHVLFDPSRSLPHSLTHSLTHSPTHSPTLTTYTDLHPSTSMARMSQRATRARKEPRARRGRRAKQQEGAAKAQTKA